jgi:hypothetical protein
MSGSVNPLTLSSSKGERAGQADGYRRKMAAATSTTTMTTIVMAIRFSSLGT